MTLAELIEDYERRRREAVEVGATAPLSKVYGRVLEELQSIDGLEAGVPWLDTAEVAAIAGVVRKTVAKWCAEGRFPGARKTSSSTGEWRIPAHEAHKLAGGPPVEPSGTPRLWRPSNG